MNTYLITISHFFSGKKYFEIDANNKADAVQKFKEHFRNAGGNYNMNSVKCVKKLQKKSGGKYNEI